MRTFLRLTCALAIAGAMSYSAGSATAAPLPNMAALKGAAPLTSETEFVRYRGHRGRGWSVGAGIAAGALIGGLLATRPAYPYYYYPGYYYPGYYPPPYYRPAVPYIDDGAIAYCMQRFKSYDPRSGTYLGYDGYRHPCP